MVMKYLNVTQSRYSSQQRARICAFFLSTSTTLSVRGQLKHCAHATRFLFLFVASLVVFLRNVNLTIFKLAQS